MTEEKVIMPKSLTAENGAKALMSGEFSVNYTYSDNDGDVFEESIPIPWTTIKEIYAMAVEHLGKKNPPLAEPVLKPVYRIFEHWQKVMNHPRSVLDNKRKRLIALRLKDGHTEADLCQAITGCSLTPHNMGQNDRSERYDSIELILRNAGQIDRFMGNATNPNIGKSNGTGRQNSSTIFNEGCAAAFESEEDGKPPH